MLRCMSKCPQARYWTPNCFWCAGGHPAWQPPPSVYVWMNYCKSLWTKVPVECKCEISCVPNLIPENVCLIKPDQARLVLVMCVRHITMFITVLLKWCRLEFSAGLKITTWLDLARRFLSPNPSQPDTPAWTVCPNPAWTRPEPGLNPTPREPALFSSYICYRTQRRQVCVCPTP